MRIGILAFDEFTDADLFLHWDLLNRVRLFHLCEDWDVKILGTAATHKSVAGLNVETHGRIDEVSECDVVLLTSGIGTRKLLADTDYLSRLSLAPESQILAAQCSGSLILGAKGLIQDKKVSAYPPIKKMLKEYGTHLVNESLVVEGNIATASGCLGSLLLSSWVIERLIGTDAKEEVLQSVMPISGF